MPKPKHRPKSSNKKRRRPRLVETPEPDFELVGDALRMSKRKFESLRDDPDLVTAVQLGRILNASGFALELFENWRPGDSARAKRYNLRTLFIMGSYLHEAMELFTSIRIRYAVDPDFKPIKSLLDHPNKYRTKILRTIRDRVGFHLDDDKVATPAALAKLNLPFYDVVSSPSSLIVDSYFDIADHVDLNYLLDELGLAIHENEEETLREIVGSISEMLSEVAIAAHAFLATLINRFRKEKKETGQ